MRILVLFAHPALEKSRAHRRLVARVPALPGITFHDLYEAYPDGDVDVEREQALLAAHELVVLQFPFYWYSTPPLVKQWEDLVLEHGWAYGAEGTRLRGKWLLCAITTGGGASAYESEGHNRFTIRQLLAPVEQTVHLCGMRFLPPWVTHGTHRLDLDDLEREAARYGRLLALLHDDRVDLEAALGAASMNVVLDRLVAAAPTPPRAAPGAPDEAGVAR